MPIQNKKTAVRPKQGKNNGAKKKAASGKPLAKKKVAIKKPAVKKKSMVKKPMAKTSSAKKKPVQKRGAVKKTTSKQATSVSRKTVGSKKAATKKPALSKSTVKNSKKKPVSKKTKQVSGNAIKKKQTANSKVKAVKKNQIPTKKSTVITRKAPVTPSKLKMNNPSISPKKTQTSSGPSGFNPYEEKQGEDYMNEAQLVHFNHVLNLWKEQLYADRDATTQHMRDDSINFPDPLDRAVLEEEHTLEWRAREREHRLIAKIDQALAHIKQGDYGYCEICGAEIGVRRLEARPTATLCIDCKTINEIRERQTGTVE